MATKSKTPECIPALVNCGISLDDATALRRVSMTLHNWFEMECGVDDGGIVYDENTGRPHWYSSRTGQTRKTAMPDRQKGAMKRLDAIMNRYPALYTYVQTDPRGASIYVIRPGDVPDGEKVESCYLRGLAVYK